MPNSASPSEYRKYLLQLLLTQGGNSQPDMNQSLEYRRYIQSLLDQNSSAPKIPNDQQIPKNSSAPKKYNTTQEILNNKDAMQKSTLPAGFDQYLQTLLAQRDPSQTLSVNNRPNIPLASTPGGVDVANYLKYGFYKPPQQPGANLPPVPRTTYSTATKQFYKQIL